MEKEKIITYTAFAEKTLKDAVDSGVSQYLMLPSGFNSFAYRMENWAKNLSVFEIDFPEIIAEKQTHVYAAGLTPPKKFTYIPTDYTRPGWVQELLLCKSFSNNRKSFSNLSGLDLWLLEGVINGISEVTLKGSFIVIDCSKIDNVEQYLNLHGYRLARYSNYGCCLAVKNK